MTDVINGLPADFAPAAPAYLRGHILQLVGAHVRCAERLRDEMKAIQAQIAIHEYFAEQLEQMATLIQHPEPNPEDEPHALAEVIRKTFEDAQNWCQPIPF